METKYIKDILDIDKEIAQYGNRLLIVAGVGAGKSTWVIEKLTTKGNVLFITSRKTKKDADISKAGFSDKFDEQKSTQHVLLTNAGLVSLLQRYSLSANHTIDTILGKFDYIVIDEVHSIASDSIFASNTSAVLWFMEYAANRGKIVIGMTGTSAPIEKHLQQRNWLRRDYTHRCEYVHPASVKIIFSSDVEKLIVDNWGRRKIIYFANTTKTVIAHCKKLVQDHMPFEIGVLTAKSKKADFLKNLMFAIPDHYKDVAKTSDEVRFRLTTPGERQLPTNCHILFSTSVLKEGIDIDDENVLMICEDHLLSNLIQYIGRARKPGCDVYVINDAHQNQAETDEIALAYEITEALPAANSYFGQLEKSHASYKIKKDFIKQIEGKSKYIAFDYISKRFKLIELKIAEEQRIHGQKRWRRKLKEYCKEWNISYEDKTAVFRNCTDLIDHYADNETIFFVGSKEHETFLNSISKIYAIKYKQHQKIVKEFHKRGKYIEIISKKMNTVRDRNRVYWQIKWMTKDTVPKLAS